MAAVNTLYKAVYKAPKPDLLLVTILNQAPMFKFLEFPPTGLLLDNSFEFVCTVLMETIYLHKCLPRFHMFSFNYRLFTP